MQPSADDGSTRDDTADAGSDDALDAGSDASTDPAQTFPERLAKLAWIPLPWAPEWCEAQVATDVSSLEAVPWVAAPSGASACQVWGAGVPRYKMEAHAGGGFELTVGVNPESLVVYDDLGAPKYALRSRCPAVVTSTGSEPCYAFTGQQSRIKCGGLLGDSPVFESSEPVYSWAASEELLVGRNGQRFSYVTSFFDRAAPSAMPTVVESGKQVSETQVLGTTALAISETEWDAPDPERRKLVRSIDAGPWQLLHDPGTRNVLTFASDGSQITWIEVDSLARFELSQGGTVAQEGTLYRAPLPAPGATLVPTQVSALDVVWRTDQLALVNGVIAHKAFSAGVHLYRLSDGGHWRVPTPYPSDHVYSVRLDDTNVTYELTPPENSWSTQIRCSLATVMAGPSL